MESSLDSLAPGIQVTEDGVFLERPPSIEAIEGALSQLSSWTGSLKWTIGSLVSQVDDDVLAQAADHRHISVESLLRYGWVWRAFPAAADRHPQLSWSHHAELAPKRFSSEDRKKWLDMAAENGWNKLELREAMKDEHTPKREKRCKHCGGVL